MANNFEFMNLPLQINQTYPGPLEKSVIFASKTDAENWLTTAYAYEGALIRIKDSGKWKIYIVQSENGALYLEEYKSGGGSEVLPIIDHEIEKLPVAIESDSVDIVNKINEIIGALPQEVVIEPLSEDLSKVELGDIYDKLNELIDRLNEAARK